jgi:hypothetical protein
MTRFQALLKYGARRSFADLSAKSRRCWQWPLQDALGDLRVRSGIKLGLAALLALYCAEALRLDHSMRNLAQSLPRRSQAAPEVKPRSDFLPAIDWFWVKIGIKTGLSAAIAILLLMWINPPGPDSIPLVAFFLTVLGRPFLRAGGTGDLRSFQNSFLAAVGSAACAGLLMLTTPFLTNYLVMNLALFFILFVFGSCPAFFPHWAKWRKRSKVFSREKYLRDSNWKHLCACSS